MFRNPAFKWHVYNERCNEYSVMATKNKSVFHKMAPRFVIRNTLQEQPLGHQMGICVRSKGPRLHFICNVGFHNWTKWFRNNYIANMSQTIFSDDKCRMLIITLGVLFPRILVISMHISDDIISHCVTCVNPPIWGTYEKHSIHIAAKRDVVKISCQSKCDKHATSFDI